MIQGAETRRERRQEQQTQEHFPTPETYLEALESAGLHDHAVAYRKVLDISTAIQEAGGLALLIGGSVRDALFGTVAKDFDLEVYNLPAERMEKIARTFGKLEEVGQAFGILKMIVSKGIDIDISLPRADSKIGEGHRGFTVKTDQSMSIHEAARRRDFTMNTVAANPLTGELHDTWGGVKDIREKRLRVTDEERFKDDPLRILRGMQFIGRFELSPDENSIRIMNEMAPSLKELPKERILGEWEKLLLKSVKPSRGLEAGLFLGVYQALHPEFFELYEISQTSKQEHAEAWKEMLKNVDRAALLSRHRAMNDKDAMVLLLSTLCGSLTKHLSENHGRSFLTSLGPNNLTRDKVLFLYKKQDEPNRIWMRAKEGQNMDGTIRRLAKTISPATIKELVHVSEVTSPNEAETMSDWFLTKARELQVEEQRPTDLIQGRDWIKRGYKPGINIGRLIALANDLRDDKRFTSEHVLDAVNDCATSEEAIHRLTSLLP